MAARWDPDRTTNSRWSLRTTGSLTVTDIHNGRDVTPKGRKARAIVAYLASRPGDHVSREQIAELLWGSRGEQQARASLRQALLEIRHALGDGPALISSDRGHLWIDAKHVATDADGEAAPFEDLDHITAEFDDWLTVERTRLTRERISHLRGEAEEYLSKGQSEAALTCSAEMSRIDRFDEDAMRIAMEAEFRLGRPAAAEQRYLAMGHLLRGELGVEPAAASQELRQLLSKECRSSKGWSPNKSLSGPENKMTVPAGTPRRKSVDYWATALALALAALAAFWIQNERAGSGTPMRIAVLPFDAAGVEPGLAEGISDELISQLAASDRLRVIGRTSSAQFKGKPTDLRSVGRMLDVQYIVEGTVRRTGSELNVVVSLVRSKDGSAVWARTFKARPDSLQPMQAAVSGAIAQSLDIQPLPTAKSTRNGQAYALYLRAKSLIRKRDEDSLRRAQELLGEAIRIDPEFAGAWAQLAIATTLMADEGLFERDGSRRGKRDAARRAIALDPDLAEAHAAMAAAFDWNLGPSARGHLRRAVELSPNDPQIMYWWALALANTGEVERANRIVEQVAALDPLWQRPVSVAAAAAVQAGDRPKAEFFLRTIRAGNPEGAREVEIDMAHARADYSRVVQLSLSDRKGPWSSAKFTGIRTLIGLGFVDEAILISGMGPTARQTLRGRAPSIDVILEKVRRDAAGGDDLPILSVMTWELARERRWQDIAALYDSGLGQFGQLKSDDPGGRITRATFGAYVALALKKAGRDGDAILVARRADEAAKFVLANSPPDGELLAAIAGIEAVLGQRDLALRHLEQGFGTGWRMFGFEPGMIDEHSIFATLRDQPRFQRLVQIQRDHIAKERREVEALGIF